MFSVDGRTPISSGMDGDWTLQAELPTGAAAVNGMAFSPDGRWMAVGAADGKIRVWEL